MTKSAGELDRLKSRHSEPKPVSISDTTQAAALSIVRSDCIAAARRAAEMNLRQPAGIERLLALAPGNVRGRFALA